MPFICRLSAHVSTCCWNVIIICYGLEMCYDILLMITEISPYKIYRYGVIRAGGGRSGNKSIIDGNCNIADFSLSEQPSKT